MLFEADYAKNYASILYQCLGGGGGICNKTAHQIRVRVNACAVHAYISCERMRSACLKAEVCTANMVTSARGGSAYVLSTLDCN